MRRYRRAALVQVFEYVGNVILRQWIAPTGESVSDITERESHLNSLGLMNVITHLGLPRNHLPIQPLIRLSPILDRQRELERLAREIHQNIGGGMQAKDRGQRTQDRQDSDSEIVKGAEFVDFAALEFVVWEGKKLDVARNLGRVDNA
jgi:hypothetical protein